MGDTKSRLYLPLTEEQADASVKSRSLEGLRNSSVAELAACSLIQNVRSFTGKASAVSLAEKALAELIKIGTSLDADAPGSFYAAIASRFDARAFKEGISLLDDLGICYLQREEIEAGAFLIADGLWDFGFSERHYHDLDPFKEEIKGVGGNIRVTQQQYRALQVFKTELDEDLDVQALAGTGKTFMIEQMVDTLNRFNPIVLAMTWVQLEALKKRIKSIKGMTFGAFAEDCLSRDLSIPYRKSAQRRNMRDQVDEAEIVKRLDLRRVPGFTDRQLGQVCRQTVMRFCMGPDASFQEVHLPNLGPNVTRIVKEIILENACRLWQETIASPDSSGFQLPIRGYHRIKQMSLSCGARIASEVTHVIIDEAHDMPAPLVQFLDRCNVPVITLGDVCQRLDGHLIRRSMNIRKREVFHSVRSGREVEHAINALIDRNPVVDVHPLEGSRQRRTKTVFYDKATIPSEPTVILVGSEWGMFEWFQRLSSSGAKFSLLDGSKLGFRQFVTDAITLFKERIRPTRNALFRFHNWEELFHAFHEKDLAFDRVCRMLEQGYTTNDFERAYSAVSEGSAPYMLGKVEHAKNYEFESVMLSPDLLRQQKAGDRIGAASAFAALYLGGTRAKHRLYVPGQLSEWASEQSAKARINDAEA